MDQILKERHQSAVWIYEIIQCVEADEKGSHSEPKMKITENQIDNDTIMLLKSLLGKTLESITHESYAFSPTSYGAVYMTVDKNDYILRLLRTKRNGRHR